MMATGLRTFFLVVGIFLLANSAASRYVSKDDAVKVATFGRQKFGLASIIHRGSDEFPDTFRYMDVEGMRAQGRADWADDFEATLQMSHRTDKISALGVPTILPDPTDKDTVFELAKMSSNSYYNYNETDDWIAIPGYAHEIEFGWESDGLQGYVYLSDDESIAVMSIKGTSLLFLGQGGPTAEKDKLMDNLMFSCCCAQVDSRWDSVCDCFMGDNTCSNTCLRETMTNGSLSYYTLANELLEQAQRMYPNSSFWMTGHSLGGSVASLVAIKNDLAAFVFEAPGELLYAQRIGLNIDTENLGKYNVFHYGNLGDPIYLGTCQGRASTCYISGYALETRCHVGNTCVYDGGYIENVNNHRISVVMDRFIEPNPVPVCGPEVGCTECTSWNFV